MFLTGKSESVIFWTKVVYYVITPKVLLMDAVRSENFPSYGLELFLIRRMTQGLQACLSF